MRHLLICGILQAAALAQPMGTCEERLPAIESRFAKSFNAHVTKYHKLSISASPGMEQLNDREKIFREFMDLHRCECW